MVLGFCAKEEDGVWPNAKEAKNREAATNATANFLMNQYLAELDQPYLYGIRFRQIVSRCQEGEYWEPGKTSQSRILASILAQGFLFFIRFFAEAYMFFKRKVIPLRAHSKSFNHVMLIFAACLLLLFAITPLFAQDQPQTSQSPASNQDKGKPKQDAPS